MNGASWMERSPSSRCRRLSLALVALVVALSRPGTSAPPGDQPDELPVVREIYVPWDELMRLSAEDPSGVVMTLEEYRALVEEARRRTPPAPEPSVPPPFDAVATSAKITADVTASAAVLRAELELAVAGEDWVRCDLGPELPHLGRAMLDGEPAWIVVEDAPSGEAQKAGARSMSVILRGPGTHRMVLEFSLPVKEVDDSWILEGAVPRSAATSLEVEVPGRASGESDPPLLDIEPRTGPPPEGAAAEPAERTVFSLPLGTADRFRLEWKLRRGEGRTDAILVAEHRLFYELDPENPTFHWRALVDVFRKKTDRLVLLPPPGARVLDGRGAGLHSFNQIDAEAGPVLEVLLREPVSGRIDLRFEGILSLPSIRPPAEGVARAFRFALGRGGVQGSTRDRGTVGIRTRRGTRLGEIVTENLDVVPAGDTSEQGFWGEPGTAMSPERAFTFLGEAARLTVDVEELPAVFDVRSTHRLRVGDRGGFLQSAHRLGAIRGRLYTLELVVPAGLRLRSLREEGTDHGLRFDLPVGDVAPGLRLRIDLERALAESDQLVLLTELELTDIDSTGGSWESRSHTIAFPDISGSRLRSLALGVEVPAYLDASLGDMSAWTPLPASRLDAYGLRSTDLVAAFETDRSGGRAVDPVSLTLRRRPSRGVYQAVLQILAFETKMRVNVEVRLAVIGRPVEAVGVTLPLPADAPLEARVPDLKEADTDGAGRRILRFHNPWLGERMFGFEFDLDLPEGESIPIPVVEIEPVIEDAPGDTEVPAVFDPTRFVVLGSLGGIEVTLEPDSDVVPVERDDLPGFARLRSEGRVVASFRIQERARSAGARSSFVVTRHERTPVLTGGVSRLDLTTSLDQNGISRTTLSGILRYSAQQQLTVELAEGSKVLSVELDGRPVRPVQTGPEVSGVVVPLPPRSYAALELVYEHRGVPLHNTGVWIHEGPVLRGLPVSQVVWTIYHPPGLRVEPRGETIDSLSGRQPLTFARTFWGRILSGRWPRWTTWESVAVSRVNSPLASGKGVIPVDDDMQVQQRPTSSVQRIAPLAPRAQPSTREDGLEAGIAVYRVPPEGVRTEIRKLGGDPRVELRYEEPLDGRFLRRSMFVLAILVGLGLLRSGLRSWFWPWVAGGLAIATFFPAGIGLESPLFWIPLAEGLVALALGRPIFLASRRTYRWIARALGRLRRRGTMAGGAVAGCLALACLGSPGTERLSAAEVDSSAPLEPVLIPYDVEDLELPRAPDRRQVYVPYRTFVDLWNRAHPEEAIGIGEEDIPVAMALGNVSYTLEVSSTSYRIDGDVELRVFTRGWTRLPLPVGEGAQLAGIQLDGNPIGVSYEGDVPFVPIRGEGVHRLSLAIEGKVQLGLGEAVIAARLVAGEMTRLEARLPPGVELDTSPGPGDQPVVPVDSRSDGPTLCHLDLGRDGRLHLRWRSRTLLSDRAQRLSSLSESGFYLDLDGYLVRRHERVKVEGAPLDFLRFRVLGTWSILSVRGRDLGDWSLRTVADEAGETAIDLELFFRRRATDFDIVIEGFAPLRQERVAPAGLSLAGASREEGFIGLRHHALARFPLGVLGGLTRADLSTLEDSFPGRRNQPPDYDRLFRFYGSTRDERIVSQRVSPEGGIETDLVGIISVDRLTVAGRVTYDLGREPGPIDYRIKLPAPWDVKNVRCEAMQDWMVRTVDGRRELVVHLRERAVDGTRIEWLVERSSPETGEPRDGGVLVRFPSFRAPGPLRQGVRWSVAATADLEIRQEPETNLLSVPLEESPRWLVLEEGTSYRMGFRSVRDDATLQVSARSLAPRARAVATTILRLASTHVDVNTRVRWFIERTGLQRFRVGLPDGARFVTARVVGQPGRNEVVSEGAVSTLRLDLPSPVQGEVVADISYRVDRTGPSDRVTLGGPVVLDVESVRDFVALLGHPFLDLEILSVAGLTSVDAARLADRPDIALSERGDVRGLLGAYQVVDRPWSLEVTEETPVRREDVEVVVHMAEIDTVLAADGSNWSVATYSVRNRSRQFLEMAMPEGHRLWRVTVDGEPVSVSHREGPSSGTEILLVPVERLLDTDVNLEVSVVYTLPGADLPSGSTSFEPLAPRLLGLQSVATLETFWRVHIPDGYEVTDMDGNLRPVLDRTRYGKKVEDLFQQIETIQVASGRANRRGRERARKNLQQLQLALSDAVAEIEKEEDLAAAGRKQIGEADLRTQIRETREILRQGKTALQGLGEQTADLREDQEGPLDPVDQAFQDARRFAENRWRDDQTTAPPPPDRRPPAGASSLESFEEALEPVPLPSRPSTVGGGDDVRVGDLAEPTAPVGRGLLKLFEERRAVDVAVPTGGQVYTYRRTASRGDPVLELTLRSTTRGGRWLHWLGLAATIGILVLWWRRSHPRPSGA